MKQSLKVKCKSGKMLSRRITFILLHKPNYKTKSILFKV